jgi:predicted double-glycine peptidase
MIANFIIAGVVCVAVSFLLYTAFAGLTLFVSSSPDRSPKARRLLAALQRFKLEGTDGVVFQDMAGCGVACYAMVLANAGGQDDQIAERFQVTPAGVSMLAIIEELTRRGFTSQGVRFDPVTQLRQYRKRTGASVLLLFDTARPRGWLAPLLLPAWGIARTLSRSELKAGHWVYLQEVSDESAVVFDPMYGRLRLSVKQLENLWKGLAVVAVAPGAEPMGVTYAGKDA